MFKMKALKKMINETEIKGKHRCIKLEQVYDMNNIIAADRDARRGKSSKYGIRKFDRKREENLCNIQQMLRERTYHTSAVRQMEQWCPCGKKRVITKLPYCPDHIIHHALMRVIGPAIDKSYYLDSYASIKGRGTSFARRRVRRYLDKNKHRDIVYAKMDFKKFYQNINQDLVYRELCRMFHDEGIRWLLREVVTATEDGLGIGLFPIQPIANFYLNRLDRMVCDTFHGEVHLFRYCDDILLIGYDSKTVWKAVEKIRWYAQEVLRQPLHANINVEHLTNDVGIDFVGYVFYKDYTLLRKSIKKRFKRKLKKIQNNEYDENRRQSVLASYKGWLMHCNGINLWRKVTGMKNFSEINIKKESRTKDGQVYYEVPAISCSFLVDRQIVVKEFQKDVTTKNGTGRYVVLIEEGGKECKFLTNNPRLKDILDQVSEMGEFPFRATFRSRSLGGSKVDYYFE